MEIEFLKAPNIHKELVVPVNGYYVAIGLTANGSGLLATIQGHKNNYKFHVLSKDLREQLTQDDKFCNLSLKRYVSVGYRDAFNEEHVDYFAVPLINGAYKIPDPAIKEWTPRKATVK